MNSGVVTATLVACFNWVLETLNKPHLIHILSLEEYHNNNNKISSNNNNNNDNNNIDNNNFMSK